MQPAHLSSRDALGNGCKMLKATRARQGQPTSLKQSAWLSAISDSSQAEIPQVYSPVHYELEVNCGEIAQVLSQTASLNSDSLTC